MALLDEIRELAEIHENNAREMIITLAAFKRTDHEEPDAAQLAISQMGQYIQDSQDFTKQLRALIKQQPTVQFLVCATCKENINTDADFIYVGKQYYHLAHAPGRFLWSI